MDCQFTEKISRLMDGELSDDEARQIHLHLSACAMCQQTQEDFLLLRQEIRDYQRNPDVSVQRQAMRNLLNTKTMPFWRRKIALPVPAFALIFFAFVALSLWAAYLRATKSPTTTATIQPLETPDKAPTSTNTYDLSRFDKGGRAVIYTARRTSTNNEPQKEIKP